MILHGPEEGDAFAFPLEDGRFGACRVLRQSSERGSVMVGCCAWIGNDASGIGEGELREILHLTHHSHKGGAHIIWISESLPGNFLHLGKIEPTLEERSLDCGSFSIWECITEQPLMQWRWDVDRDAVRAQEEIDRLRPGEILFGMPALDKPNGEVIATTRRCAFMFGRILSAILLVVAFRSMLAHLPPVVAWCLSAIVVTAIYVVGSAFIQRWYETRVPWQKNKVSGIEVNRVYRGPDWLKRIMSAEPQWLVRISCVSLNNKAVSAGVLAQIRSFSQVGMIILFESEIEESALKHFSKLKRLSTIWLSKSNLSDQGMRHLGRCRELTWLAINGTKVTNVGLAELAGLKKIRNLDLCETSISDLKPVEHWRGLKTLQLDDTQVTDVELGHLAELQLEHLSLNATAISDAGLAILASQTGLTRLQLDRTAISDDGLVHLRGMKQLEWIHLANTRVTTQGLFALESLPNLVGVVLGQHPNLDAIRRIFSQWKITS